MANSIYLGGGIKSAFCGGNVKAIWQGVNKLWGGIVFDKLVIDGLEYRIRQMPDGRIWMCDNLQAVQGSATFFENDEATYGRNGKNYGRLYNRNDAKAVANRVDGWHLPSANEWESLFSAVANLGNRLKSTTGWKNNDDNGTDDYGFCAYPAGFRHPNGTYFSEYINSAFYSLINDIHFYQDGSIIRESNLASFGFSIRLIKDV